MRSRCLYHIPCVRIKSHSSVLLINFHGFFEIYLQGKFFPVILMGFVKSKIELFIIIMTLNYDCAVVLFALLRNL